MRLSDHDEPIALEKALVDRATSGDSRAFRSIFDRYAPGVRRFARDLLGEDAAADEATQETFVRAHRLLPALREAGQFHGRYGKAEGRITARTVSGNLSLAKR